MGVGEGKSRYFLQRAIGSPQRNAVVGSPQIDARDIGAYQRAGPKVPVRVGVWVGQAIADVLQNIGRGWPPGLHLEAHSIGHVPTFGLGKLQQHIFAQLRTVGVLHRRVDTVKQSQIVQLPLRIDNRALVQHIARIHQDVRVHGFRPRVVQPAYQHIVDVDLVAFRDLERHIVQVRITRVWRLLDVDRSLVVAVRQIVGQHRIPVSGQVVRVIRLPHLRVQKRQQRAIRHLHIPRQLIRAESLLHPFRNLVHHRDMRGFRRTPPLVGFRIPDHGLYVDLFKPAPFIDCLDGRNIARHQRRTVGTARVEDTVWLYIQPGGNQVRREILIAGNRH